LYVVQATLAKFGVCVGNEKLNTQNVKVKVLPRTSHEGSKEKYSYNSTLSLTSVLDGVGGQCHDLAALLPGKRLGGWAQKICASTRI
jgi:hypothetical protein